MKKDDLVTIEISDFSSEGLGIGHAEGMAVFVKDTVIGDRVRAKIIKGKKNYCYGRLEEILSPSPDRTQARCPSARACGGCQLQMMDYRAQLKFKEEKVRGCLARIGGFDPRTLPMEPILEMEQAREESAGEGLMAAGPWRYRNKAQFPVGRDREGRVTAGFYAGRTHSIIPQRDCLLGIPENQRILDIILAHMEEYQMMPYDENRHTGLVRHIMTRKGFFSGQLMVCLVLSKEELPGREQLTERLRQIPGMTSIAMNINREKTNVIFGPCTKTIWGADYIEDQIGDVRFQISARSFYQVNPLQTRRLYQTALDYADLKGDETVWDLYCGIGTISLFLAQKAGRVCGVEIVPEAVRDAKRNAALNGFTNTSFFAGRAEEVLPRACARGEAQADVIVLDPPRKGCDRVLLDTILQIAPQRIVYVSCDPATLARDLKILCAGGYCLERLRACDMFSQTVHVECVVLMSRKDA